jgi:hypothetical protein
MNIQITQISPNEVHVIDPQTEGTWRIISSHSISKDGALIAIMDTIREKNIQPAKGSILTVEFQVRVAEEGEACHPAFDDILAQIQQALSYSRGQESGDQPKGS